MRKGSDGALPLEEVKVVKKGTQEFKDAQARFLELFFKESKEGDYIPKGKFEFGDHKGKVLGFTSKKILEAKLAMPFGCPDLFIQPCYEKGKLVGVIWFCDRIGCICVCCREDFTDEYPIFCPDRDEMFGDPFDEEYEPDYDEEWFEESLDEQLSW